MSRQLLTESLSVDNREITKIPITEEYALVESNGEKIRTIGAFTFPISRPDVENLNGRIYTSKLWENVMEKKMGEGAFGLTDHPDDGGSVKDAFCVWRNLRFGERSGQKVVLADAYLFGQWGQHAKDAIDAGGSVGLSSVGYGDFKEDGKTINESYELVRPSDWVLDPSYQVFGSKEDAMTQEDDEHKAETEEPKTVERPSLPLAETDTTDESRLLKDIPKASKSLEEKSFRIQLTSVFNEAKKINSPIEKQRELEATLSYFIDHNDYCPDLKEEILKELKAVDATIREATVRGLDLPNDIANTVEDLEKKIARLEEDNATLQQENVAVTTLLNNMKKVSEDLKEKVALSEGQLKTLFSVEEVAEIRVDYEKQLNESYESIEEMQAKVEKAEMSAKDMEILLKSERDSKHIVLDALEEQKAHFMEEKNKWLANETLRQINALKADKEAEKARMIEEAKAKAKEDAKKASVYSMKKDPVIQAYFNEIVSSIPEMVQYEDEILSAHSLIEAQKKVLSLKKEIFGTAKPSYMDQHKVTMSESATYEMKKTRKPVINQLPLREGWM